MSSRCLVRAQARVLRFGFARVRTGALRRFACPFIILALVSACHDGGHRHERDTLDAEVVSPPDITEEEEDASDVAPDDAPAPDASLEDDASDESDASPDSADAGVPDEPDAAVMRTSFETAQPIEVGTKLLTDSLRADQRDYYTFQGKAGTFYEIATDRSDYSPDTVVWLFDAQQTLIASNDDGPVWAGDAFDARLIVRIPADGLYYVRVDDPYTSPDYFLQSFHLLFYHLSVREVSALTPGFADASAAGVTFAQDEKSGYRYATVIDVLDSDQKTVAFPGLDGMALIAHAHAGGTSASGSSLSDGEVLVTSEDGHRLALIDRAKNQENFRPPVAAGKHQITFSSKTSHGSNPFFVLDLVLLPDNPREQNETSNGTKAGAEAIKLSRVASGRGLLLSRLPATDVDYYRVPAQAGQQILFNCEGESSGSGVRGLRAELRDDSDLVLGSQMNDVDFRYGADRTGDYFLHLSSTTPAGDANALEPWVRCVVIVQ
jgi:hypothetical protein